MTLNFRPQSGARERHLRRKYNNPLFGQSDSDIAQEDLLQAQQADNEELIEFLDEFRTFLQNVVDLDSNVESERVLELKARADKFYEQCMSLAGDHDAIQRSVSKLMRAMMEAMLTAAGDDPIANQELRQEDIARQAHFSLLEYPLIADLLRKDSPIAHDELVPTLLGEPQDAVDAALGFLKPEQLAIVCQDGRALLGRLQDRGCELPEAWERLGSIESFFAQQTSDQSVN